MHLRADILVQAISICGLVQAACCAMPEQVLPPLDFVLQRVLERAAKEDENDQLFDQSYAYTRTRVTESRNLKGELKKTERKESHHDPLIVQAPAQGERAVTRLHSPKDTPDNPSGTDTASRVRGKAFDRKELKLDQDLIDRFTFSIFGRENVNGRPTLVLDFEPKAGRLPERSFKDKFINKAAGRAWIDEEDYAIAKVELHLTDKVNIVAGLVGAVSQFKYGFERERTPDGLWYTRQVQWHLEGREVFIRRIVDYYEERTNVQKVR